ncbi:MAG: cyclase family protein [Candidatus Falkowbacteria bacterium]
MKYIDLSVTINNQTPVYPGDPQTKIAKAGVLSRDGYQDHYISVGSHAGTHIDAPSHMVKHGKNIDQFALENFVGNGVCIRINQKFILDEVKNYQIYKNDFVLFSTGMTKKYYQKAYYKSYPAMPVEVASYLVDKKIKGVGVDMCSVDYEPFNSHKILLNAGVFIIENMTNLDKLHNKKFKLYAWPLKLDIDGSPIRAVAELI